MPGYLVSGISPISSVGITPSGNITSVTVPDAINELDSEKAALSGATFTGPVILPTNTTINGYSVSDAVDAGAVLQIQTVKLTSTGTMSTTSGFTVITDGTTAMSITVTPKSNNSYFKLEWQLQGIENGGDIVAWCAPYKDSNSLYTGESTGMVSGYNVGDAWKMSYGTGGQTDSNMINTFSGHWVDTNTTLTSRIYSLRLKNRTGTFYINRSEANNASQNYSTQGRSIFTVTEYAA